MNEDAHLMAEERRPATLKAQDGATRPGEAVLTRYSKASRITRGTIYIFLGLLGGGVFIIIPILHLITTWALPLVGLLAGLSAIRTLAKVRSVSGECPGCRERVEIQVERPLKESTLLGCPRCRAPVEMLLEVEP